nr:MAG: hypothetical protein [Bacteriophage sp.]
MAPTVPAATPPTVPPAAVPAPGTTLPAIAPEAAPIAALEIAFLKTDLRAVEAYGATCHNHADEEEPTACGTVYIHLLGSVHLNS